MCPAPALQTRAYDAAAKAELERRFEAAGFNLVVPATAEAVAAAAAVEAERQAAETGPAAVQLRECKATMERGRAAAARVPDLTRQLDNLTRLLAAHEAAAAAGLAAEAQHDSLAEAQQQEQRLAVAAAHGAITGGRMVV